MVSQRAGERHEAVAEHPVVQIADALAGRCRDGEAVDALRKRHRLPRVIAMLEAITALPIFVEQIAITKVGDAGAADSAEMRERRRVTEFSEGLGDLVAFDLVDEHFRLLQEIIASERGAVVKTIGDAVMATFETPDRAIAAAIRMREAMSDLGAQRQHQSLRLKIGIHEGSCLAITLNDQQDYFGQTVNIASRVQGLATSRSIVVTEQVVENAQASALLEASGLKPTLRRAVLSGIADKMSIYEIP